jgi:hypothetical protein
MTSEAIINRKKYAHRLGFWYINVLTAVQSMGYSEEESKQICTEAGIDWEKDVEQTKNEYIVRSNQSRQKQQKRYSKYQSELETQLTKQQLDILDQLRTFKSILCKENEIADSLVSLGLARKLDDGYYDRGEQAWEKYNAELAEMKKLSLKELIKKMDE